MNPFSWRSVSIMKEVGPPKWRFPKIELRRQFAGGGSLLRIGWRYTAIGLHISNKEQFSGNAAGALKAAGEQSDRLEEIIRVGNELAEQLYAESHAADKTDNPYTECASCAALGRWAGLRSGRLRDEQR